MSWYKKSSVWSVVIASIAVVLSQLPPVYSWIPNPEIDVNHADRIGVNNAIGLIGHNLNVEIKNIGNTDVQLSKMELVIVDPDGRSKVFPAENYNKISTANANPIALPITSISIPQNSVWSEMVFFNRAISTEDEESFLRIRQDIAQSIFEKQQEEGEFYNIRSLIPADEDVTEKAINFFTENFDLEKGEYKMTLNIYLKDREAPFSIDSEFTIFKHHIDMLISQTEDYKYGGGITMQMNPAKQVWLKFKR